MALFLGVSRATWSGLHALVIACHAITVLYPIPLHDTADISGTWEQCIKETYEDGKVDPSCQQVDYFGFVQSSGSHWAHAGSKCNGYVPEICCVGEHRVTYSGFAVSCVEIDT